MPFDDLPREILYLITEYAGVPELRCLLVTARRVGAVAQEELYSRAVALDENDLQFPLSLAVAAITDSLNAFERLLEKTNPIFIRSCKCIPRGNPHLEKWLKSAQRTNATSGDVLISLLHILSNLGCEEMVRLALERSACGGNYLDELGSEMKTPLTHAIDMGHVGTIKLLVDAGADATEGSEGFPTPLSRAIYKNQNAAAEFFIKADANVHHNDHEDYWLFEPLTMAVGSRNTQIVDLLLEAGAGADGPRNSALGYACNDENGLPMVEHLLNAGAQANPSHLVSAAERGHIDILKLLLRRGGEFEEYPSTPLHNDKCSLPVVQLILSEAPHLANVRDHRGCTPLDVLLEYPNTDRLEDLDSIARCLVQAGGEVCEIPLAGLTVLQRAVSKGLKGLVELLLSLESQKALISSRGRGGLTALHYACSRDSSDSLIFTEWLIEAGIDTSVRTETGETALHFAASNSHPDSVSCVRTLIRAGCDKNATNDEDQNALHLAALSGHPITVQYLLENGFDASQQDAQGDTPLHFVLGAAIGAYHRLSLSACKGLNFLGGKKVGHYEALQLEPYQIPEYNSWKRHLGVLRQLLEAGSDLLIKFCNRDTALDMIARVYENYSDEQLEIPQEKELKGADDILSVLDASQLKLQ